MVIVGVVLNYKRNIHCYHRVVSVLFRKSGTYMTKHWHLIIYFAILKKFKLCGIFQCKSITKG